MRQWAGPWTERLPSSGEHKTAGTGAESLRSHPYLLARKAAWRPEQVGGQTEAGPQYLPNTVVSAGERGALSWSTCPATALARGVLQRQPASAVGRYLLWKTDGGLEPW